LFLLTIRRKHLAAAGTMILAASLAAIVADLSLREAHISAQDFPAVVGRIEGDDLEVVTTTPSGIEKDAAPTVVASGSEVTLRSGHALLLLNAGGEISICGPARFKMIKSTGAVTLALDYGRVHPSLDATDGFTIYTPTVVATPIAISGGLRDLTVGLQEDGEMCVLTARGAMRVEPQFSDQSMIIPQGGTASLFGGQIESLKADAAACSCEYPRAHAEPQRQLPPPARSQQPGLDIGVLASPVTPPGNKKVENSAPPAVPSGEPVYTVLMPMLSYDAHSPDLPPEPPATSAPPPSPETILLVREVRVRPSAEFRGHVNAAPMQAAIPPVPSAAAPPLSASPAKAQSGFFDRVRSFFRKVTGTTKSPCVGAGCDS
jgi:hypothetical protein